MESSIGVFDSGLGGVSVLREAIRVLPHEKFIYYGDNRNAPYGDRTEAEITELTLRCAHTLANQGVKAILIACNTATATCIERIRNELDVPVVSVEPAIKPACMQPGYGKILMMATRATTRLQRYLDLQARMPDPSRILNIPCPGLVERIEQGIFAEDAFDDLLDTYLSAYHTMQIDGIVLGCTHYVFIRNAIRRYATMHFSGACKLFDGNEATAHQLARVLEEHNMASDAGEPGGVEFHTSGDSSRYRPIFDMLLRQPGI